MEQTFIMIEPDGVQRGLVDETISKFEKMGFYWKGLRLTTVDRHVVAMIWEGENVVLTGREIIGAVEIGRNFIHGSDSVESARKEIALWFPDGSVNRDYGLRHLISV